jgi:uncharacterized protein YqeY
MSKLEAIRKDLLVARKSDDKIKKNLLSTFVGEVELTLKGSNPGTEDSIVETLAKKFIKNASTIGNDVSRKEIVILEGYLPQMASKSEVLDFLQDKDLSLGGRLIGEAKKHFGGNVDPQLVKQAIALLELTS